jgi:hypothetical protein
METEDARGPVASTTETYLVRRRTQFCVRHPLGYKVAFRVSLALGSAPLPDIANEAEVTQVVGRR